MSKDNLKSANLRIETKLPNYKSLDLSIERAKLACISKAQGSEQRVLERKVAYSRIGI